MDDDRTVSNKPVVAVDVDEVLALFVPALAEFHNEVYREVNGAQTELSSESFISYEFHNVWGGSKEECIDKMDKFFASEHFRERVSPMPGALQNLRSLSEHYELHIVTARQHFLEDETRAWIEKHFPAVFREVHFGNHYSRSGKSRSKAEMCRAIGAALLIDDSLAHAASVSRAGIPVLLFGDYAWNRTAQTHAQTHTPTESDGCPEIIVRDFCEKAVSAHAEQRDTQAQRETHTEKERVPVVFRVRDWDEARRAVEMLVPFADSASA